MTGAHTPGPWYLTSDSWAIGTKHSTDPSICVVVSARRHFAEVGANARLIETAPDLLAALIALVPADFDEHPGDFSEEWHAAVAAIARATSKEAQGNG